VNYLLATQEYVGAGAPPTQLALVQALDALNGNSVLNSVTNSFNPVVGSWISGLTLAFVANSTSTTLRFTDQSTGTNDVNWALDAVTVDVVPEPASYTLIGLGLGAIALFRKIRRVR